MSFEPPKGLPTVFDPSYKGVGQKVGLEIWRVEALKVIKKPTNDECYQGKFWNGDSYIILQTKQRENALERHIFFWLGEKTSQDEMGVAAYKTVELDQSLGGEPVQHREVQGHESLEFMALFPTVQYMEGGVATGFKKVDRDDFGKAKLLQAKGRRNVRVREVPCQTGSLNQGDVFILDEGRKLTIWNGKDSSKVERVKAMEFAQKIRDEQRSGKAEIIIIESEKPTNDGDFWTALGGKKAVKSAAEGGDDDEKPEDPRLFKITDASGKMVETEIKERPLKREMLDTKDAYLLDIGTQVIAWVGKGASQSEKLHIMKYATEYLQHQKKPSYVSVTRLPEGAETPMFKQAFDRWPEANQLKPGMPTAGSASKFVKKGFDVNSMHTKAAREQASMPDDGKGTLEIWRIEDFKMVPWPQERYGEFYQGDSYVMLYTYLVNDKKNYIIYFWLGLDSSQDEYGAAAISAKDLDDKYGGDPVQVRVVQNKEPPHFYLLFKGKMVVRSGGKASGWKNKNDKDSYDVDGISLYQVRGTNDFNTRAVQVPEKAASLNSGDVFVLTTSKNTFLWSGAACSGDEREVAKKLVKVITGKDSYDLVVEGQEPPAFWEALGGKGEYAHVALKDNDLTFHEPRLFQASTNRGYFYVEEIFDFDQEDLIEEDVMLLDTYREVMVWVGNGANAEEKTKALQAAIDYVKNDKSGRTVDDTTILQIKQGREPPNFTCHFHAWNPAKWSGGLSYEEMKKQLASGGQPLVVSAKDALSKLTNAKFSLKELTSTPLPEGVDGTQKENYLDDKEFATVFGISRAEYNAMPKWKANNLKKKVGLY